MQRKMSVPEVKSSTPGEKFGSALGAILSVTPERAAEIRNHAPKKRAKPSL